MANIEEFQINNARDFARSIVSLSRDLARYELEPAHGAGHLAQSYHEALVAYQHALSETVKYLS